MTLSLPPHLQRILAAEYPRFSDTEMLVTRDGVERLHGAPRVFMQV
jgi:hypothetical protein